MGGGPAGSDGVGPGATPEPGGGRGAGGGRRARDEVVRAAPPEPLSVPVPSVVDPSLNVTVPVGVPPPLVTVAVKVTACPNVLAFRDEPIVVTVAAMVMLKLRLTDVAAAK